MSACFTIDHLDPSLQPRLYDVLEAHGVRASVFVEGVHGDENPDGVAEVVERGHELGMHGWAHEEWSALEPVEEERLAARATAALERAAGVRPVGFRAPGGYRSPHSASVLRELGYRYDASADDDLSAHVLAPGLAQVPFRWAEVDGLHWLPRDDGTPTAGPDEVRERWLRRLETVAAAGEGVFVLVCHAFITAAEEERLAVLDDVVAAAVADERVAVRTVNDVVSSVFAG